MSQLLINQFLAQLDVLRKVSGTNRESVVSEAFKDLLKGWGRQHDLVFIPQYEYETAMKTRVYPDGALLYSLRIPLGYWEAKDEDDDIDKEIEKKKRKGYPQDNIIFEDSLQAVLIQNRHEVIRAPFDDRERLERLLKLFFAYERQEIADFRKAVAQFKADLPAVLDALRGKIEEASKTNDAFARAEKKFLDHARDTINPSVTDADIREMLIQHILTEDIFARVFDDAEYHRQNNIARELYALEEKLFSRAQKLQMIKALESYYAAIRTAASQIPSHAEKQTFLKVIYENFYKVYNPKAADRLGVIYTPNEIVRFMIESADWLCNEHFGKSLVDKGVDILDPATGTGTFICELLEHFRGQKEKLAYKYKEELHANEVAILPYYVANLNIEATYAAITGQYAEFPNLCFVDTLDNVAGLGKFSGHQEELFGAMSEENVERIKRQNKRRISVIIGNPPYNANQQNENDNNKNREYPRIDQRIKDTYIKESTAQKTKLYDMYARFFRWASDRIADEGIIAFVTNRSFIESRTFDGFRKIVERDFNEIWIFDLGGDVRANPKLSGTKNNVFGIQTGVAISFLVKRSGVAPRGRIFYARRPEMETREDKLSILATAKMEAIEVSEIRPDTKQTWLNQTDNDFDDFIPVASKETKAAKSAGKERAIFKLFSMGAITARDEWVLDLDRLRLEQKIAHLIDAYNSDADKLRKGATLAHASSSIKWSRSVKRDLEDGIKYEFSRNNIISILYRPFVVRNIYFVKNIVEMPNQMPAFFPKRHNNTAIFFNDPGARSPFSPLSTKYIGEYHLAAASDGFQCIARYRYLSDNSRVDNITDWGLNEFTAHYKKLKRPITKDAIFHYVYAVLHDPIYREKYALNLKREFPRIPFYRDFWRWADWGEKLMALHIGYESEKPWPLTRTDTKDEKAAGAGVAPRAILKADKPHGIIVLDSETQLSGVPASAWDYRLGNRSGLEWILDQYREKTPKDPTIREKFNTYRFRDYKEKVADLLARVTTVSVETMKIVEAMKALKRD
ncbi:MAG: DNA methyltransferase [Methylocystis sp.]|nr:MAG: DNA methyltransferase [Methylocystis sp.]